MNERILIVDDEPSVLLPDLSGEEVCRALRERSDVPILHA